MTGAEQPPVVTVCVISYNQRSYIRDCIQGLVDQETSFPYEVVVADDCSTDGTREILEELGLRYPDKIKLMLRPANLGAFDNYAAVHRAARGEFVVHMDGDDEAYPGKLQKQYDYLAKNPACSLVAHRMAIFEGGRLVGATSLGPSELSLERLLLLHPAFVHSSIMYRRDHVHSVFERTQPFIDMYVYVHCALRGPVGLLNDTLGRYNANIGVSRLRTLMPLIQEAIDYAVPGITVKTANRARRKQYYSYARAALIARDHRSFREFASAGLAYGISDGSDIAIRLCMVAPSLARNALSLHKLWSRVRAGLWS